MMDYRTGWNDAQITGVLAMMKYKEELLIKGVAAKLPAESLETMRLVVDGAMDILMKVEPKDAE
jgi:hypothetical protein